MFGKAGRAETATDPAGLDMFETTIMLKPESEWRAGHDARQAHRASSNAAIQIPGLTNAWTMPIKTRTDMLTTGIKTPVGIKIGGPDLATLEQIGTQVEAVDARRAGHAQRLRRARRWAATTSTSPSTAQAIARYGLHRRATCRRSSRPRSAA